MEWNKTVSLPCGHSILEEHRLHYGGSETFEIVTIPGGSIGTCPQCGSKYPTDYWGGYEKPIELTPFQAELRQAKKSA